MHIRRVSAHASWLMLLLAGCSGGSGGEDRVPVHPVSGTVTFSGAPVANAIVTFSPEGSQPVALGRTDGQGKFTLTTYDANDGAAAGDYVVMVSKTGGASPTSDPNAMHQAMSSGQTANMHSAAQARGAAPSESPLPDKYSRADQSPLRETVKADTENVVTIELQP